MLRQQGSTPKRRWWPQFWAAFNYEVSRYWESGVLVFSVGSVAVFGNMFLVSVFPLIGLTTPGFPAGLISEKICLAIKAHQKHGVTATTGRTLGMTCYALHTIHPLLGTYYLLTTL